MPKRSGTLRNMSARLAACEPCRRAKLACNHERPVCGRCHARGEDAQCDYRNRPFKRKKITNGQPGNDSPVAGAASPIQEPIASPVAHRYPNPGFLGQSSHSTIFDQMESRNPNDVTSLMNQEPALIVPGADSFPFSEGEGVVDKAAQTLKRVRQLDIPQLNSLVKCWLDTKANLPLAEPFVSRFAEATLEFWSSVDTSLDLDTWAAQQAGLLLSRTRQSIILTSTSTVKEFFSKVLRNGLRFEVLGVFLIAASRAAIDISSFAPLFTSHHQKSGLVKALTYIGDCCLDSCLSLDCLSDLQLVLQYENCILHTQVDGDQSYHSWRRMGDISSSLFALGYHELTEENTTSVPRFIFELRKAAFARIYSADKMLAVFLGRPPRVAREYCTFLLPENNPEIWKWDTPPPSSDSIETISDTNPSVNIEPINYTAETRCAARFSSLKEDILKLSRRRNAPNMNQNHSDEVNMIMQKVEDLWESLPENFKISTSLRQGNADAFSNDFLLAIRLDYLHTLFLLHLISSRQMSQPGEALLATAGETLSYIIEAVMLRDRLVNSGTSLVWKVAQYGLPAAGIISLALLNGPAYDGTSRYTRAKLVQDLSVLVAELKVGAIIRVGEPNFALFSRATRTMQSLLDSLMTWVPSETQSQTVYPSTPADLGSSWDSYINLDTWDFEIDFWANLAGHPTLLSHEN